MLMSWNVCYAHVLEDMLRTYRGQNAMLNVLKDMGMLMMLWKMCFADVLEHIMLCGCVTLLYPGGVR